MFPGSAALRRPPALPAALLLRGSLRACLATCRVARRGSPLERPAVYVNWHRHLPLLVGEHGRERRWMMVSGAPYMEPIARWCELEGLTLVRGASGERGREALAELERVLRAGESVALAVDGPAGPAFRCKPGCVELARACGVPIVPVAYVTRGRWEIRRRWDRMLLPTAFDRVEIRYGQPLDASRPDVIPAIERALDSLDPRT